MRTVKFLLYLLFADDGVIFFDDAGDIHKVLVHLWTAAVRWGLAPNDKTVFKFFGKKPPRWPEKVA